MSGKGRTEIPTEGNADEISILFFLVAFVLYFPEVSSKQD